MNGVISNGREPLTFSMVGIVVSVNWTWQLAHQEMTPVFPSGQLVERIRRDPAGHLSIASAQLNHAAAMRRPAHDPIGDAERIHDVERGERHMRRLEHVAAGVEHEVRAFARLCGRAILQALVHLLAEACEFGFIELHARENIHPVGNEPKILDALLAAIAQVG